MFSTKALSVSILTFCFLENEKILFVQDYLIFLCLIANLENKFENVNFTTFVLRDALTKKNVFIIRIRLDIAEN